MEKDGRGPSLIDLLRKFNMQTMGYYARRRQLQWLGEMARMDEYRLPRLLFNAVPLRDDGTAATRPPGKRRMDLVDSFRESIKEFGIDINSWFEKAQDKTEWTKLLDDRKIGKTEREKAEKLSQAIERVKVSNSAIEFIRVNPKKTGSKSHERYELYKSATSYRLFLHKGGTPADFKNDAEKGYVSFRGSLYPASRNTVVRRLPQTTSQPQQQAQHK